MNTDKHFYIIVGLLAVILVLLVVVIAGQKKSAGDLLGKANYGLQNCNEEVAAWRGKYQAGTAIDDAARNELSSILSRCTAAVGK